MTANRRADLLALAAELEAAERGSRELSDRCLLAWGWERLEGHDLLMSPPTWQPPGCDEYLAEELRSSPTESLDACAAAMPEGWTRGILSWPGYNDGELINKARATLRHALSSGGGPRVTSFAADLPLAWSAAICRVLAAEMETEEQQEKQT